MLSELSEGRTSVIATNLRALIRGLTQNNRSDLYTGYRELVRTGTESIQEIRSAISRGDWSHIRYPEEIRYVSGLVSVLHEIDEAESRRVVNEIKDRGCDPAVARTLTSISAFTHADYSQYDLYGVRVYERKSLPTKDCVRTRLEQWLRNVPVPDLKGIERMYVVRSTDLDGLGNYMPLLFSINLVWNNPSSRLNPMSLVNRFIIEYTLYHEIGHYVHRHTFGQDHDQEQEAEEYAQRVFANSNHTIFRIGRLLARPKRRDSGRC